MKITKANDCLNFVFPKNEISILLLQKINRSLGSCYGFTAIESVQAFLDDLVLLKSYHAKSRKPKSKLRIVINKYIVKATLTTSSKTTVTVEGETNDNLTWSKLRLVVGLPLDRIKENEYHFNNLLKEFYLTDMNQLIKLSTSLSFPLPSFAEKMDKINAQRQHMEKYLTSFKPLVIEFK